MNVIQFPEFKCSIVNATVKGEALYAVRPIKQRGGGTRNHVTLVQYSECNHMGQCGVCDSKSNPNHQNWDKCIVYQSHPRAIPGYDPEI